MKQRYMIVTIIFLIALAVEIGLFLWNPEDLTLLIFKFIDIGLAIHMEKPIPENVWQTFVLIPTSNRNNLFNLTHFKITPFINSLKEKDLINWFHFIVHSKINVPDAIDDDNNYLHIRLSFKNGIDKKIIERNCPDFCIIPKYKIKIRKCKDIIKGEIAGIEKNLLKNNDIKEAWRIIGNASQWIIDLLSIHKEDEKIKFQQIDQFLHLLLRMLGTDFKR